VCWDGGRGRKREGKEEGGEKDSLDMSACSRLTATNDLPYGREIVCIKHIISNLF